MLAGQPESHPASLDQRLPFRLHDRARATVREDVTEKVDEDQARPDAVSSQEVKRCLTRWLGLRPL